jgi:hypothetical protein
MHDIGDAVRLWVVWRNEAGVQTAATTTLHVRKPDGTVTLVANSSAAVEDETLAEAATGQTLSGVTGVYKAQVTADQAGRHDYRWTATGAVTEVSEGWFDVRVRRVTP